MKLTGKDIEAFVGQPQRANAALIYGPDHGLMMQRMHKIVAAILPDPNDPFNRADLTQEQILDDSARLADELSALSFTGDRRVIILRDATDKSTKIIEETQGLLHEKNYLIICADDLGSRSSLRLLCEGAAQMAALPCYKDEGRDLQQLIRDHFKQWHIQIAPEALDYLAYHLRGDRMMIVSELEKIALYFGENATISMDELRHVMDDSSEKSFDDICNALAGGQVIAMCRALDRLAQEGVHSVGIIRAVSRYFSRLQEVHGLRAKGQSTEQAVKSLRPPVFFKQQPLMRQHADRWSGKKIDQVLHLMMQAEKDSKLGGDLGDTICHQYLLRVARAA